MHQVGRCVNEYQIKADSIQGFETGDLHDAPPLGAKQPPQRWRGDVVNRGITGDFPP